MTQNERSFELEVSNFGPIVEGKIDLRPMTVFVGPSNTGKSYLAILIYALHKALGENSHPRHGRGRFVRRNLDDIKEAFLHSADATLEWAKDLLERLEMAGSHKQEREPAVVLPPQVINLLQQALESQGEVIRNEISRCFGSEAGDLLRKGAVSDAHISIRRGASSATATIDHRFALKSGELKSQIGKDIDVDIGSKQIRFAARELIAASRPWDDKDSGPLYEQRWRMEQFIESWLEVALPDLVGRFHSPAYYLPADRTGVMHAHSVVVSALIESASMRGIRPAPRMPTLSGVLADFLEQLIEINAIRYPRRKSRPSLGHAKEIEERILHGGVRMEKGEASNYPRFVYQPEGWKNPLPLMRASSMVSELAPVVLFLRHWVTTRSALIVEEPESHLHPAMQVRFIRVLAALVRSGTHVIVTTHSEWLVEELANIVGRSKLSEDQTDALRPDQLGVWLFKPKKRPKGSVIEEIRLDESGLFPTGYDDVAASLHNEWANISSRTGDAE